MPRGIEDIRRKSLIRPDREEVDQPPLVEVLLYARSLATADIGHLAAELIQQDWTGRRVVEIEGPQRVTPSEIAAAFAKLFGHSVRAEAVPRESWAPLLLSQGMKNPTPRIRMVDGFKEAGSNSRPENRLA